jgi:hypothetical protein
MPKATPVYVKPQAGAQLLIMTKEGEKVAVRQRGAAYTRVQVKRGGKWRTGYIVSADLDNPEVSTPRGDFGFGAGGMYSYLRHGAKEFETDDQVQYQTEEFTSGTFSPFVTIQYGQKDFWRLILAYRTTEFSSTAPTDLPGAAPRELTLEHTMISGTIQKMWTPLGKPVLYYGIGLEASKATDAELTLGGVNLPVASEDLPTYLGGHAALGGQLDMGRSLSAFGELRLGGYFNQAPIIMSAEAAFGLLFWP